MCLKIKKGVVSGVRAAAAKTFPWLNCAQAKQIKRYTMGLGQKKTKNEPPNEKVLLSTATSLEKRVERENRWKSESESESETTKFK